MVTQDERGSRVRGLRRWLWGAAALAAVFAATLGVRTQVAGTPPILLVVNGAAPNPYGPYLAEVLRAEGLNSFSVAQLSAVTITDLTNAAVVVLAETPLTVTQSNLFSNYVAGGGRLVTMSPDSQLLPVLGINAIGSTTTEGYFALNAATSFAGGLPTATLPFHGQAQNFALDPQTQVLATLYSNATTSTGFPAVVKLGSTITFAYDLARSVVYTRQGNPANATNRDGQAPFRTEDIFYNAIDRDKVGIPYADVQMRMLARAITDLLADLMPLPRMWYFPGTNKTLMVLTGDSHANPQSYFDQEISAVESYGGRISIYAYGGSAPSSSSAATWRGRGHEIGMHPAAAQYSRNIDAAFQANLSWFTGLFGVSPSPTTRTHQVEWQGWVDAAKIEATYGIGMDTSYYTWGPAVTYPDGHQAHGYVTGSGQPMRFVDQTGALVQVYQQVTALIDEGLITTDFSEHLTPAAGTVVSQQIIDASQAGDYAAVTTQFHVDYFGFGDVNTWATNTMNYARSLGIPMWTAQHWLSYTTARQATTFTNVSWSAAQRQLALTVGVPTGSETQSLALPYTFGGFGITAVTVDGVTATGVQQPIAGRPTIFFGMTAGSHTVVASYNTPLPTVSLSVAPSPINQGQSSTLAWSTTNAATISIDQGVGSVGVTGTRTVSPLVTTTYTITAINSAGTVTMPATLTVIPPPPTVTVSVNPTSIVAGDPATLTWSSTNAFSVTIDQGIGTVGASGTRTVSPPAGTTYTITATNTTGTATATTTLAVSPAPPGASLRFNNTSNQRARFTALPAMTVFTVEGWVKRTADTGGWETFLANTDNSYSQETFGLYVDGGNADCGSSPPDQFAWAYTKVGGGWFIQCSGVTANLNAWHHVAVSRDGANAARMFIDGVLRGTINGTAAPTTTTGFLGIGNAGDAATEYFPGLMDEVRISSIARYTSSFTTQVSRFAPDANTIALYHLDAGTGQTLADASGNNRNGFLGTSASTESIDPAWATDVPFTGPSVQPPTVVTGAATAVTATGATLNGTVNPNGSSTTALFDYGLTTGYGSQATASPAPGSGTAPVAVSAAITGLTCNTPYHFRVVGTNATAANGADAIFTTAACPPPTVVTGAATALTTTGATLNGTVNPNGSSTTARFDYGLTIGYGSQATASPVPGSGTAPVAVSAAITGLTCNTPYHFRVVGTNATAANGADAIFTTAACPLPPTVVTGTPTAVTATGATLNGTVNPNGSSTTARFDYGLTTSYGSQVVASPVPGSGTAPVAVSAAIAGLTCNTPYHFRVVGTNASAATGADATFTTAACAVPPTVVTAAATAITATGAALNGTVNPNGSNTTALFDYGLTTSYGGQVVASPAPGSGTTPVAVSAAIAGLTCNTPYHFRVVGTNTSTANGADAIFTTAACPPPTAVTGAASAITMTGATLNGTVNPNGSSTTARFDYGPTTSYGSQATASPVPGSGTATVAVSAAITGLTCNTPYHFRVVGTNATAANGADAIFTTAACPPPPPTVVTGAATAVTTTGATLNGTVNPNGSSTTALFDYGLTTSYGSQAVASPVPGSGTVPVAVSAAITGLTCNTPYHFRVVATNASTTNGVDGTFTTATCPPPTAGSSLQFNGTSGRARFTALPAMTVFTVEGWVKRTADKGRYETFLSNANSNYNQETVGVYVDGGNADCGSSPPDQFAWAYTQTGGGWFFQCSGVSANLNAWHHIAVTRDSSNTARIFIDGVLRGTLTNTAAPTTSAGAFGIGNAGDAEDEFFAGLLDEVRISNVARYSSTFSPPTTPFATDANTVALYHLDEGSGQALADSSGNARNGFLGTSSAVESVDPQWSTDSQVH